MKIHPSAVVSPQARIGNNVVIHPFCVVEAGASIGDDCILEARVTIKSGTSLGSGNHVFEGAILGGLPQHIHMPEHPGDVVIGQGNVIRENVTIHRALEAGHSTIIGDHNLFMVNVHVAHDCHVGNHVIIANNAMLAGHVTVEDRAYLSGAVGVHQFCRVGQLAMVGGQSHVVKDIPPFVTVDGASTFVVGLNKVGLRRNGFTSTDVLQLKEAYKLIFRSGLPWNEIVARLDAEFTSGPAAEFPKFFHGGKRGFTPERRLPRISTIKLHEALPMESEPEFNVKAG